jgi:glycosyltransferase involved in cell wall biosynthesis
VTERLRVLQSFPHKIGADRICDTAWHQAEGVAAAGADLLVFPGVVHRALPQEVRVRPTLARGRWRIPYRVLGKLNALALHDHVVARRLERLAGEVDVVHVWPVGALKTLETAARLGIPSVLERPNTHTRYAYEVVQREAERLGVKLPRGGEHVFNARVLRKEEQEYRLATRLLCPSEFVVKTFLDADFPETRLARHFYGYDETVFHPPAEPRERSAGLTMLFVGYCAVRKGVHFALQAWLDSPASRTGTFLIAGEFLPAYAERLSSLLAHPSVRVLGHRTDVAQLMRQSDLLVMPSIEEGFGIVTVEAQASGCVPLVSDVSSAACTHEVNALVHRAGDVDALREHITAVYRSRELLETLREGSLSTAPAFTWRRAGERLLEIYREVAAGERPPLAAELAPLPV